MNDWENDPDYWNEGGETLEDQARSVLEVMEKFNNTDSPHQEEIEDMFQRLTQWVNKFGELEDSPFKAHFHDTLIRTELNIALKYLEVFNMMESPDEETCSVMAVMLKILDKYGGGLSMVKSSDDIEKLAVKKDEAILKISSLYPEILDEDDELGDEND